MDENESKPTEATKQPRRRRDAMVGRRAVIRGGVVVAGTVALNAAYYVKPGVTSTTVLAQDCPSRGCTEGTPTPTPDPGCTPGYWKNHTGNWPSPYLTGDLVDSSKTFNVPDDLDDTNPTGVGGDNLLFGLEHYPNVPANYETTNLQAAQILLKAAITALLNRADPIIDPPYPMTDAAIKEAVNFRLVSTNYATPELWRAAMITLARTLDGYNNEFCH